MAYAVAEQWRPLNPTYGMRPEEFPGFEEGLVKILADGPKLAYVRNTEELMDRDQTLIMRTVENHRWIWFARMIEGGIAVYTAPELQGLIRSQVACDLPKYMQVVAETLDGLFQHYQDIPTENPLYSREVETLNKIHDSGDRFRRGEPIRDEDMALFWGIGTPFGEPGEKWKEKLRRASSKK